ncbi:MAG: hypothetical protein AVDCRST_MAG57-2236, partial [uncultured Blastococcus sp.]
DGRRPVPVHRPRRTGGRRGAAGRRGRPGRHQPRPRRPRARGPAAH